MHGQQNIKKKKIVCLVKKFTILPNVAVCIRTRRNCSVLGPLFNSVPEE